MLCCGVEESGGDFSFTTKSSMYCLKGSGYIFRLPFESSWRDDCLAPDEFSSMDVFMNGF